MTGVVQHLGMAFVVVFMFSVGLETRAMDIVETLQRPRFLLRALVVALVLIPLAVALPIRSMDLAAPLIVATVLLAAAPGAPFVPMAAAAARASVPFATTFNFTLGMLTAFTAPASLSWLIGRQAQIDLQAGKIIVRLIALQILPLVLGLLLRRRSPSAALRIDRVAKAVFLALLVVILLVALSRTADSLKSLGWAGIGSALFATVVSWALALLGGHDGPTRRSVLVTCGAPNLGLGLAVITTAGAPDNFKAVLVGMWVVRATLSFVLAHIIGRQPRRPLIQPVERTPLESQAAAPPPG